MRSAFREAFGVEAQAEGHAPARVNLIGDHTDYADGFCLPMPLRCATRVAMARAPAFAARSEGHAASGFDPFGPPRGDWTDYVAGPLAELAKAGIEVPPVAVLVASDIPQGAGVSSSAALEVAVIRAALALAGTPLADADVARMAQRAENLYCGVNCGILDQMASAAGRMGEALLLDCRTGTGRLVSVPAAFRFRVVHCGEARRLADGVYNERRRAVEEAASILGLSALRDAVPDDVERLPAAVRARARHVVAENARVLAAVAALEGADLSAFGRLMTESHRSLATDYEVSTPALDRLADAMLAAGAAGARLTGAGFGGCAVALLPPNIDEAAWWGQVSAANPEAWLVAG
ncbi:MAG: galactokinase [Parvibaculum sp.]|uniref:galactokinase n=1 Tax=Parvibaculum sp. TaxID=2024848 RepID=UPI002ABD0DEA|nr:galactokinase [Parvibaculum sp.]MDZ4379835.1 galactokinase [Parvibaculum sp.]